MRYVVGDPLLCGMLSGIERLPDEVRACFVDLAVVLYIDVSPFVCLQLPRAVPIAPPRIQCFTSISVVLCGMPKLCGMWSGNPRCVGCGRGTCAVWDACGEPAGLVPRQHPSHHGYPLHPPYWLPFRCNGRGVRLGSESLSNSDGASVNDSSCVSDGVCKSRSL